MPARRVPGSSGSGPADAAFSLAVITCTRDRPASLRRTLESFAAADRNGIALRVVVVNNSADCESDEAARSFQDRLPIRLVREERPGKCFALNRGLLEVGEAEIIAIVDDDITVDRQWFQGVRRITDRWPDQGYFAGSLFVVWPAGALPAWARDPFMQSWGISVMAVDRDRLIRPGRWALGGCFWFRARLLPAGYRFRETWLVEPPLMLDLAERGAGGVIAPDARAWHHIQPGLLDIDVMRRRAALVGEAVGAARLIPYRSSVKQAALFHQHPLLSRTGCCLNVVRWLGALVLASCSYSRDKRIVRAFKSVERIATNRQYLVSCRGAQEYRIRIPFSHSLSL